MRKKIGTLFLTAALIVSSLTGCAGRGGDTESVDSNKTQLYVGYYYSGLGKEWIQQAKTLFEEKYADKSFEEGKKGVQVVLDLDKSGLNGGSLLETIKGKRDSVFFIENGDYYKFTDKDNRTIADITDIVTSTIDGENVTIEDKLDAKSKAYYNLGTADSPSYYALPYYEGVLGINYNIDLFEKNNWYFAEGKCADDVDLDKVDMNTLFISSPDQTKSSGPDGVAGTDDDGLPATYKDFEALLIRIKTSGSYIPLVWNGNYQTYLVEFMNTLWADAEGLEQFNLNWSMNGTATNLVEVNNGKLKNLGKTKITGSTGYKLHNQEGKYHALEFAKLCVSDSDYYHPDAFSSSLTHTDAQRQFLNGTGSGSEIAMLIDGNWWEVEATSWFDSNESSEKSKLNRKFGFMPIPKASKDKIGEDRVQITLNSSMAFINANTSDEIMPVAKEFLKFCHTDEIMNIFTQTTSMMKPFNYTLTEDTLAKTSNYGKEMYKLHQAANDDSQKVYIVDCYPTTAETIKNTGLLNPKTWGWSYGNVSNPFVEFKNNPTETAEDYFNNVIKSYTMSWGSVWN